LKVAEGGGCIERDRAPVLCRACGTAGVIVPVDVDDPIAGDPAAESLRAVWLGAGLEQGRLMLAA